MMKELKQQTRAWISPSMKRPADEDENFRSLESLARADTELFGSLLNFADETLGGGCGRTFSHESADQVILIPLAGLIEVVSGDREPVLLQAGEIMTLHDERDSRLTISNPYVDRLVNYLRIVLTGSRKSNGSTRKASFELTQRNTLQPVLDATGVNVFIGCFNGRSDTLFNTSGDKRIFCWVVQGAFEVQERLLEARDGLLLGNTAMLEMEALSYDAIILLLEF